MISMITKIFYFFAMVFLIAFTPKCTSSNITQSKVNTDTIKITPSQLKVFKEVNEERAIVKYKKALYLYNSKIDFDKVDSIYKKLR